MAIENNDLILTKIKQHEFRIDRAFAQGDVKQPHRTLVRVIDGKRVETKIKANSPNQERINDALVGYFQKQVNKQLDYFKLREEALLQLEEKFSKHGLNKPNLTFDQKRIRAGAIQQVIDKIILDQYPDNPTLEIGLDELLNLSKLKSAKSFKIQIETILSILNRAGREVKRDVIDLDTMTVKVTEFKTRIEVIGVDIAIDQKIGKYFKDIQELVDAEINPIDQKAFRNKKQFVKKIVFTFSKEVLPHIVCQGTDYVSLDPAFRQQLQLQNTYAIDTYTTSIQHAQEYRHLTDFTPEDLQKKFGHNYKRFDRYLKTIIDPCIEEINRLGKKKISYILKRKGYEWGDESAPSTKVPIEKFRWVITNYEKSPRDGIEASSYYIALQILQNDEDLKNRFESVRAFAMSISEQLNSDIPSLTSLAGKTVEAWKKEALHELECERQVIELFQTSTIIDVLYDMEYMRLISSSFDVENVKTPSQSLAFLYDVLHVKRKTQEPKTKMQLFPIDDEKFIYAALSAAIEQNLFSPLHFIFSMYEYYKEKNRKSKDWLSLVNMWLMNGKYDKTKEYSKTITLQYKNDSYVGTWNYLENTIDADDIVFTDISCEKMANLIATQKIKMNGVA